MARRDIGCLLSTGADKGDPPPNTDVSADRSFAAVRWYALERAFAVTLKSAQKLPTISNAIPDKFPKDELPKERVAGHRHSTACWNIWTRP